MLIPNHPRAQRIHGVPLGVVFAGSVSGAACMTHEPADFDDHVARMNMDFDSDDLLAQSFEEQAEEQVHFDDLVEGFSTFTPAPKRAHGSEVDVVARARATNDEQSAIGTDATDATNAIVVWRPPAGWEPPIVT